MDGYIQREKPPIAVGKKLETNNNMKRDLIRIIKNHHKWWMFETLHNNCRCRRWANPLGAGYDIVSSRQRKVLIYWNMQEKQGNTPWVRHYRSARLLLAFKVQSRPFAQDTWNCHECLLKRSMKRQKLCLCWADAFWEVFAEHKGWRLPNYRKKSGPGD